MPRPLHDHKTGEFRLSRPQSSPSPRSLPLFSEIADASTHATTLSTVCFLSFSGLCARYRSSHTAVSSIGYSGAKETHRPRYPSARRRRLYRTTIAPTHRTVRHEGQVWPHSRPSPPTPTKGPQPSPPSPDGHRRACRFCTKARLFRPLKIVARPTQR